MMLLRMAFSSRCPVTGTRAGPDRVIRGCASASPVLEPTLLDRVADEVGAAAQAEFLHPPGPVGLDGLDAQLEAGGDLLVAVPGGSQPGHLRLPVAQGRAPLR